MYRVLHWWPMRALSALRVVPALHTAEVSVSSAVHNTQQCICCCRCRSFGQVARVSPKSRPWWCGHPNSLVSLCQQSYSSDRVQCKAMLVNSLHRQNLTFD